jgi:RNA-splicing ligase RtcB
MSWRPSIPAGGTERDFATLYNAAEFAAAFELWFLPGCDLRMLFDASHNTCEMHVVDRKCRELFVHRKGATRAFGPGHESLPRPLRSIGQPVLAG